MALISTTLVMLVISTCFLGVAATTTTREKDRVGVLPGQPADLPFNHFSGYIRLHGGPTTAGTMMPTRRVFYYFVEHDNSSQPATEAPLFVWFSSGRFCSPVGSGGMLEVGPLRVQADMTLRLNEFSWHKEANLLFVDLPAGVGFSYSKNVTAAVKSDEQIARDAVSFLSRWTEKFPQHRQTDLYLGGEGHGAHHAIRLASQALRKPSLFPPTRPLRGILLGNPETDLESTFLGFVDLLSVKGMMTRASQEKVLTACLFNSSADCGMAMHLEAIRLSVAVTAINEPLCSPTSHPTSKFLWFDPCSDNYLHHYLNTATVQKALHANFSGRVPGPWKLCSKNLRQGLLPPGSEKPNWIIETIKELVGTGGQKLKIAVYHGDETVEPPATATLYALRKIFNVSDPALFEPWKDSNGDVGGYKSVYLGRERNLSYFTVRGAGGYIGSYQPLRARDLFRSFLRAH